MAFSVKVPVPVLVSANLPETLVIAAMVVLLLLPPTVKVLLPSVDVVTVPALAIEPTVSVVPTS